MKTTFVATGDSFITRRIPEHYPGRDVLQELLMKHDVRFNNLEITCHEDAGYPAAFSGGTWAMADPAVLDDLKALGLICLIRLTTMLRISVMEVFWRRSAT